MKPECLPDFIANYKTLAKSFLNAGLKIFFSSVYNALNPNRVDEFKNKDARIQQVSIKRTLKSNHRRMFSKIFTSNQEYG